MSLRLAFLVAATATAFSAADDVQPCYAAECIGQAQKSQLKQRPHLLPYNPSFTPGAAVVASDKMARFTVLTDRLIRMEYAFSQGKFEDRASLAVLHRATPLVQFTSSEANGVLTITTDKVKLSYVVGSGGFTPTTLSVDPVGSGAAEGFPGWKYGDANPGNLLGTIRGQDQQAHTPLNCTTNAGVDDNGEFNHCEWGLVSRDGWVVYDDTNNAHTDANDWWSTTGSVTTSPTPPANRSCDSAPKGSTDAQSPTNAAQYPQGTHAESVADCCAKCSAESDCTAYVFNTASVAAAAADKYGDDAANCWPLQATGGEKANTADRALGTVSGASAFPPRQYGVQFADVAQDLYGFFHGLEFKDALADYAKVGGKAIMVPRYAMGIWWSRWFDLNNYDSRQVIDDYESRDIPLDVFVLDMDWHTKDDWSGFTFDEHLFPDPADAMEYIREKGLFVTMNLHDNSGVNNWDAMFPALRDYVGLPAEAKKVDFDLINATVAYAVEDIVLGDLINNKHVSFWWIDWQQGGAQGGMTGYKQNPTMWTAHLRCTDLHRVGDETRAMVLARWGGMGHHRYQVGFSGDVASLSWANLAYQPYFSATAANVLFPSWSHDIEGDWSDLEMYTRWLQAGSFSGTMRSHERGMSAGDCADDASASPGTWGPNSGSCAIIAPWNVGPKFFAANRRALQSRSALLPYIYTAHRALYDTGVGILQPLYYEYPRLEGAYRMNETDGAEYFFGPDLIVAPIVKPAGEEKGDPSQKLASKSAWLGPGSWYDGLTGELVDVSAADGVERTRGYTLGEIPHWYRGGAVVPFIPLKSMPSLVGVANKQYEYLGFRLIPGAGGPNATSRTSVYEDNGATTEYLDGKHHVWTDCVVDNSGISTTSTVTISSRPSGGAAATPYAGFPASRAYQLRLPNRAPPVKVTVNGADVPFKRWGAVLTSRKTPSSSQWYYAFEEDNGVGPVIDLASVDTSKPVVVTVTWPKDAAATEAALNAGLYGTLVRGVYAHANQDVDRTNPDENSPGPAYLSQLASVGVKLEKLADPAADAAGFGAAVAAVPALLASAVEEVGQLKATNGRRAYTLALLQ